MQAGEPVTILDVRWQLSEPDGRAAHAEGHIPGAMYVSLEDELTDHTIIGRGRHPLPSGRTVEAAARRWGVRQSVPVVVYDDWNRAGSARAWWVLTAAGIPEVRILDGGLGAWIAAGRTLEAGSVVPDPGDVRHDDLYAGALPTLTADETATVATLLDARAPERFRTEFQRGAPLNYTALQNAFAGGPATSPMEPGQVASDRIRLLMGLWYHVSDGDGLHLNALQLRCAREASVRFGTQT